MKCPNCGADLTNDVIKCPFCKEILNGADNPKLDKCDFKYTITSEADMDLLKKTMEESFKKPKLRKKIVFKGFKKIRFRKKTKRSRNRQDSSIKSVKSGAKGLKPQTKMNIAFFGAIAVIVILIALFSLGISAFVNRDREITPIVYTKDNSMYLNIGKKPILLTENVVDMNSVDNIGELSLSQQIENKNIIKNSENGMYTYYFENYDLKGNSGSLIRIFNGKKKKVVSTGVHNSYILSPDGKAVLFLQSADENGDMGNLCYWNDSMKEPLRIAVDIDKDTFIFSTKGDAVYYIRNYNYAEKGGDLCFFDLNTSETESVVLDSNVKSIIGTDNKGKKLIYSKAVDKSDTVYDIYVKAGNTDRVKIFDKAVKKPLFAKEKDNMLVYGYNDDKYFGLYDINLSSYKNNKIASQITTIIKASDDFKKILYNKVYDNNTIDCYVYIEGQKTFKIAENVRTVPSQYNNANQFSVSDDFMSASYVSGFDRERVGGKLYSSVIKEGECIKTEIADDVYLCRISPDGKNIIYGKDFSKSRLVFDLYLYKKGNSQLIEEGIDKSFFGISKDREKIAYINNFDVNGFYGTLSIISVEGDKLYSVEKSGAFSCIGENGVLYFEEYNVDDDSWTISYVEKKKKKIVDSGVDGLVLY